MFKRTFENFPPGMKPNHSLFDNNCNFALVVKGDPFFDDIGLVVDVFHFTCKHSVKDNFCQQYCNPAGYPELHDIDEEGKKTWYFNSSIAEQTNVWLAGYSAICREMIAHKFDFFLDEMVMRKNLSTERKLERQGRNPGSWSM